jgi:hypothetical protein
VKPGATFGGKGTVAAPVSVGKEATLSPGDGGMGEQTFSGGLSIAGTLSCDVANVSDERKSSPQCDRLIVKGGELKLADTSALTLEFPGRRHPDDGTPFWTEDRAWTIVEFGAAGKCEGRFGAVSNGKWEFGTFSVAREDKRVVLKWTASATKEQ